MKNKNFFWFLFFFVCILWIWFSGRSLFVPMVSSDGDPYSRLQISVNNDLDNVWLPLHLKILTFASQIYVGQYYFSARLTSFLSTLFSGFIIALIIYKLSRQKWLSLLGFALFLFYPLVVEMSTLTFSEPLWAFCVLAGIYFSLFVHKKFLFIGIFFWVISLGIRYESWMLTPFFWLVLILENRVNKKNLFLTLSLLSIFPVFWLIWNFLNTGDLFNFLVIKQLGANSNPAPEWGNFFLIFEKWAEILLGHIASLFFIVLFFLSVYKIKKPRDIFLFSIPIIIFVSLLAQVAVKSMEYFAVRYLYLLIPVMIIVVLSKIFPTTNNKKFSFIFKIFLVLLCFVPIFKNYFSQNYLVYSKKTNENINIDEIVQYINYNSGPTKKLIYFHNDSSFIFQYLSFLTHYKTLIRSYTCNLDRSKMSFETSIEEATDMATNGDYILYKRGGGSSCDSFLENKTMIAKSGDFELYTNQK